MECTQHALILNYLLFTDHKDKRTVNCVYAALLETMLFLFIDGEEIRDGARNWKRKVQPVRAERERVKEPWQMAEEKISKYSV